MEGKNLSLKRRRGRWPVSAKSPWLNRIEPYWVHGKQVVIEADRLLTAQELIQRVCDYFGCEQVEHLSQQVS